MPLTRQRGLHNLLYYWSENKLRHFINNVLRTKAFFIFFLSSTLSHLHLHLRIKPLPLSLSFQSSFSFSSPSCLVLPYFCMTAFLTYCSHLNLGLSLGLLPFIFKFKIFVILPWLIPQICPHHLILLLFYLYFSYFTFIFFFSFYSLFYFVLPIILNFCVAYLYLLSCSCRSRFYIA